MFSVRARAVLVRPCSSICARSLKNDAFFDTGFSSASVLGLRALSSCWAACVGIWDLLRREGAAAKAGRAVGTMLAEKAGNAARQPFEAAGKRAGNEPDVAAFLGLLQRHGRGHVGRSGQRGG